MTDGAWRTRGGRPVPDPTGSRTRLLIAGDTHGNRSFVAYLAKQAVAQRCCGIVQLGDFGFWPDPYEHHTITLDETWLSSVAEIVAEHRLWMRVIDGNHDFTPGVLASYKTRDQIVALRDGVLDWARRGARWKWCTTRFGALGGAVSIDRHIRTPGHTWWPEEGIDEADVERLGSEPLDVLLTHDAPLGAIERHVRPLFPDQACRDNRQLVEAARKATRAKLVIHGHFHHRYSETMSAPPARVEGLDADSAANMGRPERAWAVLELPSLAFTGGERITRQAMLAYAEQEERMD